MKKGKSSWLVPSFLKRLDQYLLLHWPTVWQTQAHYVLFYGLVASLVFLGIGLCWPNTVATPLVAPLEAIILQEEGYFPCFLMACLPAIFYWFYQQLKIQNKDASLQKLGSRFLIYMVLLLFIFGWTMTSFRIGTIIRTAHLIDEEDLEYIREQDYFLYGIILSDSLSRDYLKDIEEGESLFKQIKSKEDSILARDGYDGYYQVRSLLLYSRLDLSSRSSRSSRSDRSPRSDRSSLSSRSSRSPRSNLSSLSDRSSLSYLWYLSSLSDRLYRSDRSSLSYLSSLSSLSDRSSLSPRSSLWNLLYLSNLSDLSNLSYLLSRSDLSNLSFKLNKKSSYSYTLKLLETYTHYYQDTISPKANTIRQKYGLTDTTFTFHLANYTKERIDTLKYKLHQLKMESNNQSEIDTVQINTMQLQLDTIKNKIPNLTYYHPIWFYQLEDGVRSVEHAQYFLAHCVLFHYWKWLFYFLPFIALFLLALPFFRSLPLFVIIYAYLFLGIALFLSKETEFIKEIISALTGITEEKKKGYWRINYLIPIVPFLASIGLAGLAYFQKNNAITDFLAQTIWLPLFALLGLGLLCDYHFFLLWGIKYTVPTWTLIISCSIGLIVVFLMTYIRSLPRS